MDAGDHRRGMRVRREVLGDEHVDRAIARTDAVTADFQDFITHYAWAGVWSRDGLDRRQRSLATIAALVTLRAGKELAMHVRAALRNGLSVEEVKEVILHTAIYAGVPAANAALEVAHPILLPAQGAAAADRVAGGLPPADLLPNLSRLLGDRIRHGLEQSPYPDLNANHAWVLRALPADGARTTDLAGRGGVSTQAASEAVTELVGDGYLERLSDERDGRAKIIRLTGKGVDARSFLDELDRELEARLAAELGGEVSGVLAALARIVAGGRGDSGQ
ncbi:MAG: carboxymuconolactone decarboxylase family protein [Actinobacteria bacterium]|nr:carboxymuconolactone decarboxylase family protein [Actinomycetota bacterium]